MHPNHKTSNYAIGLVYKQEYYIILFARAPSIELHIHLLCIGLFIFFPIMKRKDEAQVNKESKVSSKLGRLICLIHFISPHSCVKGIMNKDNT